MRKLLLLRPEPGLSASAERARRLGIEPICCPLFRVEAVAWVAPDPAYFDALLLTSANAVRHGGDQLAGLKSLPVHAVGEATAQAAREAGFRVESVGARDILAVLADISLASRLLHLAGEDHRDPDDPRVERHIVYRSAAVEQPGLPSLDGLVIAVHSPRAAARIAELAQNRVQAAIAAISPAAAEACGTGWERVEAADRPDDNSLLALAATLCHTLPPG